MSQLTEMRFLALGLAAVLAEKQIVDAAPGGGHAGAPFTPDQLIARVEHRASVMFTNHEREILRAQLEK